MRPTILRSLPLLAVLAAGAVAPGAATAATAPTTPHPRAVLLCIDLAGVQIGCPPRPPGTAPAPAPAPTPQPPAKTKKPKKKSKGCANATLSPSRGNLARINKATLCLVNRERTKRGRRALKRHSRLRRAARTFATQLVAERFFDHTAPDGTTMLTRIRHTGYLKGRWRRWSVGENIAYGTGQLATPKAIVAAWMKSPGHRRNILRKRFRQIGLGVTPGDPGDGPDGPGATYVNDFGQRVR